MSKQKWGDSSVDSELYDIARGLYDSKVNVTRPPTAAQHGVYTATCRGPPRAYSAKARLTSGHINYSV